MSDVAPGRFVWHDLMTVKPDASLEFFRELCGWEVREIPAGDLGTYRMLLCGGRGIGGLLPLEDDAGLPSHFTHYLTVEDVDAAVRKTPGLHGEVRVPGFDIPGIGRMAVIRDPRGAWVCPFRLTAGVAPGGGLSTEPGGFAWCELRTDDAARSRAFYRELAGWEARDATEQGPGTYTLFLRDGEEVAGCLELSPGSGAEPHWLVYIATADVDAAAAAVRELGGEVLDASGSSPRLGPFAIAREPAGAVFALCAPESRAG